MRNNPFPYETEQQDAKLSISNLMRKWGWRFMYV